MSDYRELLLGCGHARDKRMGPPGSAPQWRGLVTLDHNPAVKPDIWCDLNRFPWLPLMMDVPGELYEVSSSGEIRLPSDFFDEVHAYEVLEHLGQQGDAGAFFACFAEIWRILKAGGWLFATVPSRYSGWLWGDPSHRRAILPETLVFLDQSQYIRQLDGPQKTPMSDFRALYHADFEVLASTDNHVTHAFALRAVKPSRIPEDKK